MIVFIFVHCFHSNEEVLNIWQYRFNSAGTGAEHSKCEPWPRPSEKQWLIQAHRNCRTCSSEREKEMYPNSCQVQQWKLPSHVQSGKAKRKSTWQWSQLRAQIECVKAHGHVRRRQGSGQIAVFLLEGIAWGGSLWAGGEIIPQSWEGLNS